MVTPPGRTAAQDAAAALGKNPTNEQISNALRQSGLTEQQVRDRLRSAGYDASLADPFFSRAVGASVTGQPAGIPTSAPTPGQADAFAKALTDLGILEAPRATQTAEEKNAAEEEDRANRERRTGRAGGVFGKDIFFRSSTSFDPITSGPVDPGYRVGVGDNLQLVVTGQVELPLCQYLPPRP